MIQPTRKIIQIIDCSGYVNALCDDGTVWQLAVSTGTQWAWKQRPDIPQPEEIKTDGAQSLS